METWTHRDKRIALQNRIVIVISVKKRYCIMKKQFATVINRDKLNCIKYFNLLINNLFIVAYLACDNKTEFFIYLICRSVFKQQLQMYFCFSETL